MAGALLAILQTRLELLSNEIKEEISGLSALFFIAGLLVWNALRRLARGKPKLFFASLAALADDRNQLASRS